MKQMLKTQLKSVPQEQREKIEAIMEKDPDFLMQIAGEVQQEMKNGKDQQQAFMEVAQRHQEKLKELLAE